MKCKHCGGERFTAHQIVRMDIIVDGDGEWVQNLHEDDFAQNIYDSERPYGPFQCCGCGAEYDELAEGEEPYSGPVKGWKGEENTCPVCGGAITTNGGDDNQFSSLCDGKPKVLWTCHTCGSFRWTRPSTSDNENNASTQHEADSYGNAEDGGTLKFGCFPCTRNACVFNHEGICKYARVYGNPPGSTPDGGCPNYIHDKNEEA